MTAQQTQTVKHDGLPALGADETNLLRLLDSTFEGWGLRSGAEPMTVPPLLPAAKLARLDFYENFPHQAVLASPLDMSGDEAPSFDHDRGSFPPSSLEPAGLALPSAACYGVYLHFEGRQVPDGTTVTVLGRCFRKEQHYEGLRRLLGFHMREVVALGSKEHVDAHLARFSARIAEFADALDLELDKQPATDPFYDRGGSRALLQKLTPVKHEFLAGDLAIASVNVHRNFFGEKCGIAVSGTGEPIFTSCVAFGLERWLSALARRYGDFTTAASAVKQANAQLT